MQTYVGDALSGITKSIVLDWIVTSSIPDSVDLVVIVPADDKAPWLPAAPLAAPTGPSRVNVRVDAALLCDVSLDPGDHLILRGVNVRAGSTLGIQDSVGGACWSVLRTSAVPLGVGVFTKSGASKTI